MAEDSQLSNGNSSEQRQTPEGQANETFLPKAEIVVPGRRGDVLIKQTLLKADHFPGCQNKKLTPLLDGAPNFRQIEGLPVYGVAIPTTRGLRNVLEAVGATQGRRRVLWHNMREEPVIYINGKPYVVREAGKPFANLEYTGIDRSRVEDMELRLKQDILNEAKQFEGNILVAEEDDNMQVVDVWEPVTEADVQTPLEVYAELAADGYDIDYMRVPVTDEKAPKDSDFELLIQRLWAVPSDAALVFNCQMGRGRTTTGMIIASLVVLRRSGAFGSSAHGNGADTDAVGGPAPFEPPQWFRDAKGVRGGSPTPPVPSGSAKLKAGMYGVIRSLLRVLERGSQGKAILDATIDAASAMQNLREAIATYRSRMLAEDSDKKRATVMGVCLEYLERYYMLLAFTSYLTWHKFDPTHKDHISFEQWMGSRPELRSILSRMLRRNPMASLELHFPAATLPPAGPGTAGQGSGPEGEHMLRQAEDRAASILEQRSGAVLGADTILKEDYFPGMKSAKLPQSLPGASNFRAMVGCDIYGVAMSTVAGIRRVLQCVTIQRPGADKPPREVLWINMREEPVVYINGVPFVLRDCAMPMRNLQEYAGIDATRLEAMERRLKADVLAEAARYNGRVLVARESLPAPRNNSEAGSGAGTHSERRAGSHGELVDQFEAIPGPEVVQTPAEVYASLRQEGFAVSYMRVPVTDGRAPSPGDIDEITQRVRATGFQQPVVFNCQLGAGRTTTGMTIAGLLQLHADAAAARQLLSISTSELDLNRLNDELQGNSPKSEDDERDGLHGPSVWELSPEEIEEQRSLAAGGYVGVRRVVRLLENGDVVKRAVDAAIDANGQMVNLRSAIMRYRHPRLGSKGLKSEVNQRHAAFTRGSAYLERYCLLIAFAAYLDRNGVNSDVTFERWLEWRPDLQLALQAIHGNPAAALAAVPVTGVPVLAQGSVPGARDVTQEEQAQVLNARRGKTLTRRIILKSYSIPGAGLSFSGGQGNGSQAAAFATAVDARQARGLPIYTVGNVSAPALRALLQKLGAGKDGSAHVVITDVREELVVYINGVPYIRRELEMPAAALHHAGIHAKQLLALEAMLKEDVRSEAVKWGGRILLHQELPQSDISRRASVASAAGSQAPMGVPLLYSSFLSPAHNSFTSPGPTAQHRRGEAASPGPDGAGGALGTPTAAPAPLVVINGDDNENGAAPAANGNAGVTANGNDFPGFTPQGTPPVLRGLSRDASISRAPQREEEIAAPVDQHPGSFVAPFWEPLADFVEVSMAAIGAGEPPPDPRSHLGTARDTANMLADEGLHISYRRIPLSRERTPEAGDLQDLHKVMLAQCPNGRQVIYLVLSRTATGSSARFAASALCCYALVQQHLQQQQGGDGAAGRRGGRPPFANGGGSGNLAAAAPAAKRMRRSNSDLGEYRGIMSVSRLLPNGMEVKALVDAAIDRCERIGNLRNDIKRCKGIAEAAPQASEEDPATAAWAARQLGLHYLKRYFLLIAFTSFLRTGSSLDAGGSPLKPLPKAGGGAAGAGASPPGGQPGERGFVAWAHERKELGHLLHHLTLET